MIDGKIDLLGYELTAYRLDEAVDWCLAAIGDPAPKLLVTMNPELIVRAENDPVLKEALKSAEMIVADGVGVLWAARQLGARLPERVPGVELVMRLLERGGTNLRVYFLGARPGVAERAAKVARERYGTHIAGIQHGYFKRPEEVPAVIRAVAQSEANLLLAGLGEGQERFLHGHRGDLNVPLMIGVGGSLDVLAGDVKRTPAWTRRLGLEWAWRVGMDRKRWHRFPRLLAFMKLVRQERRRCKRA